MAIIENIKTRGSATTSTLSGNIVLDENAGELRVNRRNGADLVTLAKLNSLGFTYSELDGTTRIHIGASPRDGHIGDWISKPGIDVIEELTNG